VLLQWDTRRTEDVLAYVDQRILGLFKELNEKIDETQVDLRTVKTDLKDGVMDTKKDFYEAIVNTGNDLHEKLSLIFQVEAQTMKAEIRANQERLEAKIKATRCEFQTQLKEVEAWAKRGR
jgi:hypothetical protein